MKKIITLFISVCFIANSLGQIKTTEIADVNFKAINIGNNGVGDYTKSVVLLHEVYDGVKIGKNYAIGTITAMRGATGALNRTNVVNVNTSSAYDDVHGSMISLNTNANWKLVTVTYEGKKYMALDVAYSASWHHLGLQFKGWTLSTAENMKIIAYENVRNTPSTILNEEIANSMTPFTPNMIERHDVSKTVFNGNVGIGTDSPDAKLTIQGPDTSYPNNKALKIITNAESTAWKDQVLISSDLTTGYGIAFGGQGHHRGGIYAENTGGTDSAVGSINIWTRNGQINLEGNVNVGGETNKTLKVRHINGKDYDSSDDDALYLNYSNGKSVIVGRATNNSNLIVNGNIGIGTRDTSDYKLAVAGSTGIIAEKVTVKVQNQWPDYVFENDYDLPTLKEVEKHIKEKGHLENIPSAKEMEENDGIDLGAMNTKLLQKIEELTLYTIQQEKEISNLKKKFEKLEELLVNQKKE